MYRGMGEERAKCAPIDRFVRCYDINSSLPLSFGSFFPPRRMGDRGDVVLLVSNSRESRMSRASVSDAGKKRRKETGEAFNR